MYEFDLAYIGLLYFTYAAKKLPKYDKKNNNYKNWTKT